VQTVLDEDELEALSLNDELKQQVYESLKELKEVITKRHNSGESKNPPI
jgi:hypothetical protein